MKTKIHLPAGGMTQQYCKTSPVANHEVANYVRRILTLVLFSKGPVIFFRERKRQLFCQRLCDIFRRGLPGG